MTADANSLTSRATEDTAAAAAPVPAPQIAAFAAAFGPLGYDPAALLRGIDLDGVDLADPDALVPCEMYGWIVQRAQQERFTPNLALGIARNIPLGAYPLLDYLVSTADSVGAAAHQLSR
jgi:hypothetical protein